MSQEQKERRLNLRLTEAEWNRIQHHASATTSRNLSEYCRKVLLNKPVRILVRDQSFDDFEEDLVRLLPILNNYGDNLGRLVDTSAGPDALQAILHAHTGFMTTAGLIKELLIKIADTCARK